MVTVACLLEALRVLWGRKPVSLGCTVCPLQPVSDLTREAHPEVSILLRQCRSLQLLSCRMHVFVFLDILPRFVCYKMNACTSQWINVWQVVAGGGKLSC